MVITNYNSIYLILLYIHKPELCLFIWKFGYRLINQFKVKIVIKCLYVLYNFSDMRIISLALFPDFFGTYNGQSHKIVFPFWKRLESIEVFDYRIIEEHKRFYSISSWNVILSINDIIKTRSFWKVNGMIFLQILWRANELLFNVWTCI